MPRHADMLITGASVIAMTGDVPAAPHAIAIAEGRILAVGPEAELSALMTPATTRLDMPGCTVLPGFIDSHVHFTQAGLGSVGPNVYGMTSRTEVLQTVADAAAALPAGRPLLVHGLSSGELDAAITRADLDRISSGRPIMIGDVGAHAALINSRAWELLDLPGDLPGISRDADLTPTGLLKGKANTVARYRYYTNAITDEMRVAAMHRAGEMAAAVGITTVHALEGGSPDERGWLPERDVEILLREQESLPVQTVIYFQSTDVQKALDWKLPRIGGCIWVDGAYDEGTAALLEPYCNCANHRGSLYFSDSELNRFVGRAHRAGLQISMHAIGDAAIKQLLDAYERALSEHPRADHRHRIEHFSLPTPRDIARAARLGVAVGMQPNFATVPDPLPRAEDPPAGLVEILGFTRYQRRHPYRKIREAGILIAGGSDADPRPMGPLIGIQALANHPEPERHLSVYEALELYTINGARIAFEEIEKGTIEVGKRADLVILGADPLRCAPDRLADIQVVKTIVGGKITYNGNQA